MANTLTRDPQPLATLDSGPSGPDWDAIGALLQEWGPDRLVVGVPYNRDGSESELTREASRFARRVTGRFGIPADVQDERLTSAEAEGRLRQARSEGVRRRRVARGDVDRLAAAVILQGWLERND